MKLVDELIQNHHRALVFSQFTSHLALIEKELKRQGITYQSLADALLEGSEMAHQLSADEILELIKNK